MKRITRNDQFTLSVKLFPSSRFAIIKFFNVCIDHLKTPFPVCILVVQYSLSILGFLKSCLSSFEMNAALLSDFFSGIPYKLKLLRKLITTFVSEVLQIFTVGHLLNLSTAISNCSSPCKDLISNFPVKSICIS